MFSTRHLTSAGLLLIVAASTAHADDPAPGAGEAATDVRRFAMNPYHANVGRIDEVGKDGTLRVVDLSNPRFALNRRFASLPDLSEGLYLGFVGSDFTASTEDTRLVRVQIVEIGEKRSATIRVSAKAAAGIEKGEQLVLFRPPGATTKQLEASPEYVKVDDGRETTVLGRESHGTARGLSTSRSNLKQVGLAMHNFHDVHGALPPAVVYGPDGKPWHSWRVLILPQLEQSALYEAYRFDEPWDGPNNKKLLDRMPQVYSDPAYGENPEFYTHYAAATGPGASFTTTGITLTKGDEKAWTANLSRGGGALSFRDFTDGLSNTIMVGSVGPEQGIPWTKPEDVVFEKEFPRPGEKGSFAAPYESRGRRGGVFLYGDGSVRTIRSDVDAETWQYLLTRNDGMPTEEPPGLDGPVTGRPGSQAMQYVEVYRTAAGWQARLIAD
jgi:hypothetical protein